MLMDELARLKTELDRRGIETVVGEDGGWIEPAAHYYPVVEGLKMSVNLAQGELVMWINGTRYKPNDLMDAIARFGSLIDYW